MNLGSPASTSEKDVKTYLNEFLMDERVIDVPAWWRNILVKGIIVPFRAAKSAVAYRSVWTSEGSPLIVLTKQLQAALQLKTGIPVEIAMRYGNPSPKIAFDKLHKEYPELNEVILFPLYPHYAMSSYETAVVYAKKIFNSGKYPFELKVVSPFYNNKGYIQALADTIRPYLREEYDQILFSYHGIPERHIIKSDCTGNHCLQSPDCCEVASPAHGFCYRHQVIETTHLTAFALGIPKEKYAFSFQSRLGRNRWLQPYTSKRLEELPGEGIKKILVVCPAFVSDCLETLEEMGQEGKETFLNAGGKQFTLIPCLNVHPSWLEQSAKLAEIN